MKIAMLLHKSVEHDSRVRREASALAGAGHEVTVVHLPRVPGELDGELDGFRVVSVTPPPWVRRRLPFVLYRLVFLAAFVRKIRELRPDVVHAHDAAMLAPGSLASRLLGTGLVYDSHEYTAGVPYRERTWALFVTTLERTLIRRCDAVITVSDGIANRLTERYRLAERPTVARNIPDPEHYDWGFQAPDLRGRFGVADAPLVLHQGAVAQGRGCETLVRAVAELSEWHLLFLGADDPRYVAGLRRLAHAQGAGERVHFTPAVAIAQLPAYTRQADVGVSLLENSCENHRLALPNKVFEYLMCGLPVVVSDLPELRGLAGQGFACEPARADDPVDVARALRAALRSGDSPARKGASVLPATLSWDRERLHLTDLFERLAGDREAVRVRRRALVLVRNACTHDTRVLREADTLVRCGYDVLVLGVISEQARSRLEQVAAVWVNRLAPSAPASRLARRLRAAAGTTTLSSQEPTTAREGRLARPGSAGPRLGRRLSRLLRTADYYRRGVGVAVRERPALVHCNDYNTAWIGVAAKVLVGSAMVYDAHELWPDRNLRPEPRWWLLVCESLFVRVADRTITTSPGYAVVMAGRYGIPQPAVVRNVPAWEAGDGSAATTADGDGTVVYFGAITENRGLDTAVQALTHSPGLRLRLIGPDAWGYRDRLALLAERLDVADRVSLDGPVAPEGARQALAGAAVGLALIEPACLSYRLTLPNKLFEYTLAGVPILASDVPVTAEFVRERSLGFVTDPRDSRQVATALEQMLQPDVQSRLREALTLAQAELSWEAERERLAWAYRVAQVEGTLRT